MHILLADELTKSIRTLETDDLAMAILGSENKNIKLFENELGISLKNRGKQLIIEGPEAKVVETGKILSHLEQLAEKGQAIKLIDILNAIRLAEKGKLDQFNLIYKKKVTYNYNGQNIQAKNIGQADYIDSVGKNDVVFGRCYGCGSSKSWRSKTNYTNATCS